MLTIVLQKRGNARLTLGLAARWFHFVLMPFYLLQNLEKYL